MDLKEKARELLAEGKEIQGIECHRVDDFGATTVSGPKTKKWMNDVNLFASRLPKDYPLRNEIETTYFHRTRASAFFNMISYLESFLSDDGFVSNLPNHLEKSACSNKEYDVFISHANKDKTVFVDELYNTILKLGVRVFYDKEVISWGDNWKQIILDGTAKSEFAIIVISNNFFGREWTERELSEFLKQQNSSHQKIVLPLLLGISRKELVEHYPTLEEIQYISSEDYSVEEICILLAKELIKRMRE